MLTIFLIPLLLNLSVDIQKVDFTAFAVSGDLLWDYEYFLRRGLGRVRVEPVKGQKVSRVTDLTLDYGRTH